MKVKHSAPQRTAVHMPTCLISEWQPTIMNPLLSYYFCKISISFALLCFILFSSYVIPSQHLSDIPNNDLRAFLFLVIFYFVII